VLLDRGFGIFADHPTRPRTLALTGACLVGVALLPTFSSGIQLPSQVRNNAATVDQERALIDLSTYLIAHPEERVFQDADWGAYLEAHVGPDQKVFIDTRYEVHQSSVWDNYLAVVSGRYDWQTILDQYGVDSVAIDPDRTPILAQALDTSANWERVWTTDHNAEHIVVWDRQPASQSSG
jgi:hypothetical protein